VKNIPVHDFPASKLSAKFEVMPWRKEVSAYDVTLPHRHNYYEVLVFLKGRGKHEIDFTTYPFHPPALHFVPANSVHVVKRAQGSAGFSILFAQEFLPQGCALQQFGFYHINASPVLNLGKKDFAALKPLLDSISEEYFSDNKMKRETLQSLLHVLLIKAQRLYENVADKNPYAPPKNEFARQMEKLVDSRYKLHWRARDYAREMNMSVAHLSAQCRQHFSKSAEALAQERLLLEVKRMLVYSDKTVKEICFELHFDDPAYFIRFFKKNTGATPLEYRKSVNH
jgi:AraC-like DNA-binding protein